MEHARTVTREFSTGPKAVLHLEARSGTVLVEGRDSDRVTVEATVRIWTDVDAEVDEAAELVERSMEQDAHRVIVRAPALNLGEKRGLLAHLGLRSASIDYHVRVPRTTAVRVLSRSGSTRILNTQGVVHAEALSGRLAVEEVQGDVTVIARSGSVQVERIAGNVKAEARSGKLNIQRVRGRVEADARSGSVDIESIEQDVRVSASSGSLSIADVGGRMYVRSRAGSMRYRGAIRGDVDVEAHAGSITFAVDPDVPFFLDAESQVGSVRSDLPPRRNGAKPAEGGPRVKLRTRAGSIRLTRA
jgi:DUF4097 and DUF4098 domain-containing protein YvlB